LIIDESLLLAWCNWPCTRIVWCHTESSLRLPTESLVKFWACAHQY